MTDRYVPAYFDQYGPRKGPTLAVLFHMAEGGGTVGYLDKSGSAPARGVSVHYVIEYDGSAVRMLDLDDACGGLNPNDRSTDKAYYGHSTLVAVLGDWWRDPNSATIQFEYEGFQAKGPNPAQIATGVRIVRDLRKRFPELRGALGHADQTDTKFCPGTTAAMRSLFDQVGGHGLWKAVPMVGFSYGDVPGDVKIGSLVVTIDGAYYMTLEDGKLHGPLAKGFAKENAFGPVKLDTPIPGDPAFGDRSIGYIIPAAGGFLLAYAVKFTAYTDENAAKIAAIGQIVAA